MAIAWSLHAAGDCPLARRRVVQLSAGKEGRIIKTSCDEDLAVREEGCRMKLAVGVHALSDRPGAFRRNVQFRAGKPPARREHLTIWQQCQSMVLPRAVHAAGLRPSPGSLGESWGSSSRRQSKGEQS